MAKTIMLQGTSSSVGKSVLSAALCRIFVEDGFQVAPFKAQNMALNSFVTSTGGEMGRAQVVQAEACRIAPDVIMNPILLKPTEPAVSQVIVLGKPVGNLSAAFYHHNFKEEVWKVITESLAVLMANYEILVIEGAGSPAEVNLKANDVVNMRVAKEIQTPVLLVADIDRGGALASIVGTLELLEPEERQLIKGLIINKFRGDINLLQPALDFLEQRTKIPVVGVIPYFTDFKIPEEDSVVIETLSSGIKDKDKIDIAVINLPHISNFTDFDALAYEPDVEIRYIKEADTLGKPDLIIIPGSKNTIADMHFLRNTGLAEKLTYLHENYQVPIIGICGGYQILGKKLIDPYEIESSLGECTGLGLLDIETEFIPEKVTTQITGEVYGNKGLLSACQALKVAGYEIHMGKTSLKGIEEYPFALDKDTQISEGSMSSDGLVFGTYLHGIFDNDLLRRQILNNVRNFKGWLPIEASSINVSALQEEAFNKLAKIVRDNVNLPFLYEIMGLENE